VIRRRGEGRRGRSRQAARRIGHVRFQVGAPAERGSRLRGVECGAGHHDACFRGALLIQGSCRTDGDAVVLAVDGRILTARAPVTGIRGEEEDMLKSRLGERRDGGADESVLTVEPVRPRPLGRSWRTHQCGSDAKPGGAKKNHQRQGAMRRSGIAGFNGFLPVGRLIMLDMVSRGPGPGDQKSQIVILDPHHPRQVNSYGVGPPAYGCIIIFVFSPLGYGQRAQSRETRQRLSYATQCRPSGRPDAGASRTCGRLKRDASRTAVFAATRTTPAQSPAVWAKTKTSASGGSSRDTRYGEFRIIMQKKDRYLKLQQCFSTTAREIVYGKQRSDSTYPPPVGRRIPDAVGSILPK